MQISVLTRADLENFMPIMTNEEIYGLDFGRCTCFGVYDEKNDTPAGILSAAVYPEFILIKRLFVATDYRRQGIASELLSLVCDLPEDLKLPFLYYTLDAMPAEKQKVRDAFLSNSGFERIDTKLSCISSTLEEVNTRMVPLNSLPDMKIFVGKQISESLFTDYVMKLPHDEIIQFPEKFVDMSRFSEGSLVCMNKGKISATALLEDLEHTLQIPWFYANDAASASFLFMYLRGFLLSEYEKGTRIRFVFGEELDKSIPSKLFHKCEQTSVELFQLKEDE